MNALFQSFYFFLPLSSKVNILKPAFYLTIVLLLTDSQVELHYFQIPTMMSHSKSFNTLLLEVKGSSKNKSLGIRTLSDLTLQIILDG